MSVVAEDEFLRSVAASDVETRRSFVAAVWEARGRDVQREGEYVRARDPATGLEERILVFPRDPSDLSSGPPVDAVVTSNPDIAEGAGCKVITPAELYRVCRYAIRRDRSEELVQRYLGVSTTATRESEGALGRTARPLVAVVVVGLVVAVAFGVGAFEGTSPPVGTPDERTGSEPPAVTPPRTPVLPPGALGVTRPPVERPAERRSPRSAASPAAGTRTYTSVYSVTVGAGGPARFDVTVERVTDPETIRNVSLEEAIGFVVVTPRLSGDDGRGERYFLTPGAVVVVRPPAHEEDGTTEYRVNDASSGQVQSVGCRAGHAVEALQIRIDDGGFTVEAVCTSSSPAVPATVTDPRL